jgi:hypothetical protein
MEGATNLTDAQRWLNARIRPANWLDIGVDEVIHPEITGWVRTLVEMQKLVFAPEIRERLQNGSLPKDFVFWAGQLLQPHGGGRKVRINEEVRGVPYLRTSVAVERGEPVKLRDLENLEVFDLEDDELDCGHFTIFWTGSNWVGSFDFRSGRAKCKDLLEKAQRFVLASRLAANEGLAEPTVDALHTASELAAKASLILSHYPADKWKSHGAVSSAINKMGQLGNIEPSFLSIFNELAQTRGQAKYATGFELKCPSDDDIGIVEVMIATLLESVEQKKPKTDGDTSVPTP